MKQFKRIDNLDDCEYICPCGSSCSSREYRGDPPDKLDTWIKNHRKHLDTNEVLVHISDDGMRCLGGSVNRDYSTTMNLDTGQVILRIIMPNEGVERLLKAYQENPEKVRADFAKRGIDIADIVKVKGD